MNITRDVITDLLPAYVAGEASADSRALVEEYLKRDPEFARLIEQSKEERIKEMLRSNHPSLPVNHEVETLSRLRAKLRWRLVLATATASSLVIAGALAFHYHLSVGWLKNVEGIAAMICAAGIVYTLYTYLRAPRPQLRDFNLKSPSGWFFLVAGVVVSALAIVGGNWKQLVIGVLVVMVGIDRMRVKGRTR